MSMRVRWNRQLTDCMSSVKPNFSGNHKKTSIFVFKNRLRGTFEFFECCTFGYLAKWRRLTNGLNLFGFQVLGISGRDHLVHSGLVNEHNSSSGFL